MIDVIVADITTLDVDAIVNAANRALAYESSFARAREAGDVRTIAFPAISAGVYGYPKREAAAIAIHAMRRHESEFDCIVACAYDDEMAQLYRSASVL